MVKRRLRSLWVMFGLVAGCAAERPDDAAAPSDPLESSVTPEREASKQAQDRPAVASIAWLPESVSRWSDDVEAAAERHGVDPRLVALVTLLESRGEPQVRSPAGARGLMQLMPETASEVASRQGLADFDLEQLDEPAFNLDLGVAHLAELHDWLDVETLDAVAVGRIALGYNGGLPVARGEKAPTQENLRYQAALVALWKARGDAAAPPMP